MNIGDMPDVKVRFEVQQPNIAPAWMIGARTHLLDCWEPQLEWIRMPELQFPRRDYWVSLDEAGHSAAPNTSWLRHSFRRQSRQPLELNVPYHDVRIHGPDNIALSILDGAMMSLACQNAARELGLADSVTAIISSQMAPFCVEVYRILGIPTRVTDRDVSGRRLQTNFDLVACMSLAGKLLPQSIVSELENGGESLPKKLYLARRGSRAVQNSTDMETELMRAGFTTFFPEDHSVIDQFRHLWHAETIFGLHGAGLAALLLRAAMPNPRPVQLIEVFGPGYIVTLYRHLIATIGGQWVGIRGRVTPEVVHNLDHKQGQGLLHKVIAKLPGPAALRFLFQEPQWQRTHQSSSFAVDPASIRAAFDVLNGEALEPHSRPISFAERIC